MFDKSVISVATEILIVGGAFGVIVLVFILVYSLVCIHKIHGLIRKIRGTYENIVSISQIPLMLLDKYLNEK